MIGFFHVGHASIVDRLHKNIAVIAQYQILPTRSEAQKAWRCCISWGGMASAMFVPLFAGLFWPRATRAGALASSIGGLLFAVLGFFAKRAGLITFHEIYPGLAASAILMLAFTLFRRSPEAVLRNRFSISSVSETPE
jgi:Na+/proline symporter